jgi:FAD/FMN-containing dehydrogenase
LFLGARRRTVELVTTVLGSAIGKDFGGELLAPGDAGYDEARTLWNADIDRRPRLIARCRSATDVVDAVRLAREHDLRLSVRGGGHGVGGHAVADDGLMIDLSPMKDIRVDPAARTVRAEAGVVLGELDGACQAFARATPAGIVTHTGISGLTLGGGIGWLMRKHGATVDNLLSADVVTANGTLVTASEEREPELFWGLRGGGGNFGVVTSFEYRTHEVGPEVLAGAVAYSIDSAGEVLRTYRDAVADAPDELTTILTLRRVPALPAYPKEHWNRPVVNVAACYCGDLAKGEEVVRPLRALGSPVYDLLRVQPFVDLQRMFDPSVPWGWHYYWKTWEVPSLEDGAIDLLVDAAASLPSPQSYVIVFQLGGAIARVMEDATAYPQRDAAFNVNINGVWLPGEDRAAPVQWVRSLHERLEPFSAGRAYVNFLGDEPQERVRDMYGPEKYARLVALKDRYDPENVFRLNQNILPGRA